MKDDKTKAAIPEEMLRHLYMPRKAKMALEVGVCLACGKALDVIDTWERACPDAVCGYEFNWYD